MRLAFALLAGLIAVAAAYAADRAATPQRSAHPRPQLTIRNGPTFESEAARRAHIRAVRKRLDETIGKLRPPVIFCARVADGAIQVDGKLNEAAWKKADVATDFRGTRDLKPSDPQTRAMLLWDSKYLYVAFDCPDTDVVATITKPDGDFWREDTAEVFLDPDGDAMDYLEFEFSPRKLVYDGALADYRPEIDWIKDIEHLDVYKSAEIYKANDLKLGVNVAGTLNDSKDYDQGWTCEAAISFRDIERGTTVRRSVPQPGDEWRVGLYRINIKGHGNEKFSDYGAWNPTMSWFHVPALFGRLIFTNEGAK